MKGDILSFTVSQICFPMLASSSCRFHTCGCADGTWTPELQCIEARKSSSVGAFSLCFSHEAGCDSQWLIQVSGSPQQLQLGSAPFQSQQLRDRKEGFPKGGHIDRQKISIHFSNILSLSDQDVTFSLSEIRHRRKKISNKFENEKRHVEFKYWQNTWVEITSKEFETTELEFRRKVNAKYKTFGVRWVEKWFLKLKL